MGWPLKRLADELGVSLQQVQRYEQGVNKISASLLYQLSKSFKTDISSFFEGFEEDTVKPTDPPSFKVLLVEDNPHDEFLFRKAIADFPKKLVIFALKDGQEAFTFFQGNPPSFVPDIIFLDLNLPHFRGFDLLQNIKRKPQWKDIPVIIMTTSTNDDDISRSYHLQSSGFIRKSFQFEEFKNNLLKTLDYWVETVHLPSKSA